MSPCCVSSQTFYQPWNAESAHRWSRLVQVANPAAPSQTGGQACQGPQCPSSRPDDTEVLLPSGHRVFFIPNPRTQGPWDAGPLGRRASRALRTAPRARAGPPGHSSHTLRVPPEPLGKPVAVPLSLPPPPPCPSPFLLQAAHPGS